MTHNKLELSKTHKHKVHLNQIETLMKPFRNKALCYIWDKVFKNGPSNFCGRQPLKYSK